MCRLNLEPRRLAVESQRSITLESDRLVLDTLKLAWSHGGLRLILEELNLILEK
jgi:hypothetical protein